MSAPRHLLSAWPTLRGQLAAPKRVAFFTDFDGTLVRIERRPGGVRLAAPLRRLLAQLARAGAVVGVVSGRRLADVRGRVGVGGIWYAGVHGFFLRDPANLLHSFLNPKEKVVVARASRRLARLLRGIPGIALEPKEATVAVHYRGASRRSVEQARAVVGRVAREEGGLRLVAGKRVWEFFPRRCADKWSAIRFILRRERGHARAIVFLGDDTSDERVFARLRPAGISVVVGRRRRTAARYFLRSPAEVRRFMRNLAEVWQ